MFCAAAAYMAVQQTAYATQSFNPTSLSKLMALKLPAIIPKAGKHIVLTQASNV
jgi:hypothetical protein